MKILEIKKLDRPYYMCNGDTFKFLENRGGIEIPIKFSLDALYVAAIEGDGFVGMILGDERLERLLLAQGYTH